MTKIYLIRHAEAEGNLYRRIHGHYNGDVTSRGVNQIALLVDKAKTIDNKHYIDKYLVYC